MAKKATDIQTIAFVSLGCPKNLVDSERMLGLLAEDGLALTPDASQADAIVINTCGFLEASKDESLREIRDAVQMKKAGRCKRVVVAGCLVQRHKTKLLSDEPGIDRLVGVFDREHIVEAVRGKENPRQDHGHYLGKYHDLSRDLAAASGLATGNSQLATRETKTNRLPVFENDRARLRLTPRHFAYLRMSEGCNQGCTFCTIPSIRGLMRSKPIEQILLEAKELAADGAVELNLIGQDTTSYGTDIGYTSGLAGLLQTLDKQLSDVRWLRLMYAYPSCFTDEMIKTIADCSRVVKYIDMPLQHVIGNQVRPDGLHFGAVGENFPYLHRGIGESVWTLGERRAVLDPIDDLPLKQSPFFEAFDGVLPNDVPAGHHQRANRLEQPSH